MNGLLGELLEGAMAHPEDNELKSLYRVLIACQNGLNRVLVDLHQLTARRGAATELEVREIRRRIEDARDSAHDAHCNLASLPQKYDVIP